MSCPCISPVCERISVNIWNFTVQITNPSTGEGKYWVTCNGELVTSSSGTDFKPWSQVGNLSGVKQAQFWSDSSRHIDDVNILIRSGGQHIRKPRPAFGFGDNSQMIAYIYGTDGLRKYDTGQIVVNTERLINK